MAKDNVLNLRAWPDRGARSQPATFSEPNCEVTRKPTVRRHSTKAVQRDVVESFARQFSEVMRSSLRDYRVIEIEERLLAVLENVDAGRSDVVQIDTMGPGLLKLICPFTVVVRQADEEFVAEFVDANLTAYGDTKTEAVWNLKDVVADTFGMLTKLGGDKLGPGPKRQLQVLQQFIKADT